MKRWKNIFLLIFAISWLLFFAYKFEKDSEIVLKNHEYTIGIISNYYWNDGGCLTIGYEYEVGGKSYSRIICHDNIFKWCVFNKDCIGKKFAVIYSKEFPKKSLINLKYEIVNIKILDSLRNVKDTIDFE